MNKHASRLHQHQHVSETLGATAFNMVNLLDKLIKLALDVIRKKMEIKRKVY